MISSFSGVFSKGLNHQVGQWIDDQSAANFLAEVAKKGAGVHEVPLSPSVQGRAFLSDGTEVTVDMAIVVVKKDDSVRTGYPFNSGYER